MLAVEIQVIRLRPVFIPVSQNGGWTVRLTLVLVLVLAATLAWGGPTAKSPATQGSGLPTWEPNKALVLKWIQTPLVGGSAYSSQLDNVYPFYSESSDDFLCSDPRPIVAVEWWGTYWNGTWPPYASSFIIRFYDDVPGSPSHPGNLLYEEPCTVYTEEWDTYYGQYHYFQDLTAPFPQIPGNIYWVSVQAVHVFTGGSQWGWCEAELQWNDYAVMDFALLGIPRWTPIDALVDLAFGLYVVETSPVEDATWSGIKALYQ
jgi:hypothetical protein